MEIYNDSQLVVCQITKEYQAHGDSMVTYLAKAKCLLEMFQNYKKKKKKKKKRVQ